MASFDAAYAITRKHEGGYANNPNDFGGETYKGIARRYHPTWEGWSNIDRAKSLSGFPQSLEENKYLQTLVLRFYKNKFWDVFTGDNLDQDIANELFDTGVNMGPERAVRYLQTGLNALNKRGKLYPNLRVDGRYGPRTHKALQVIQHRRETRILLKMMNVQQGAHYLLQMAKYESQEDFARGWFNRVEISHT